MFLEMLLENFLEGVVKEVFDSEVFKEEGNKMELFVVVGEKEMVVMVEYYNGEVDVVNVNDIDI